MSLKKPLYSVIAGLLIITLTGCSSSQEIVIDSTPLRSVGDIRVNPNIDDTNFHRCNGEEHTDQYFNYANGFRYKGEKKKLVSILQNQYKPVNKKDQNGFVRIRFVVNCKGQSGMFRVLESDVHFEPFQFHPKVTSQLLEITKQLDGWFVVRDQTDTPVDYYQYLIFKIKDGKIEDIMP